MDTIPTMLTLSRPSDSGVVTVSVTRSDGTGVGHYVGRWTLLWMALLVAIGVGRKIVCPVEGKAKP